MADGTAAQPILFTSGRDDTARGDTRNNGQEDLYGGQWNSIQFTITSTGNLLDHVEVRYGGAGSAGMLVDSTSSLSLTNSVVFRSSSSGLRVVGSNPTVTGNTFQANNGAALSMDLASNPAISGNTLAGNLFNALVPDSGSLPADNSWDDPDIVYWLPGDLTVPEGKTLTIVPGQIVKFQEFSEVDLIVNGTLNADGTAAQPIVFTTGRDDSAGGDTRNDGAQGLYGGQWNSLQFASTSSGNLLDHVEVRYGGASSPAEVLVNGGQLTLTNSVIRNSSTHAIAARSNASVELASNLIIYNSDTGIRAESGSVVTAVNNTLKSNFRGVEVNSATAELSRNRIVSNIDAGIRVESGSSVTAINNVIDSNRTGMSAVSTAVSVVNNTIVFNETGISAGDNSNILTINNIVAFQTRTGISARPSGRIDLRHNDIFNPTASVGNFEGITDPQGADGNISQDPRFFARGRTGDYRLFQGSPAIDAALSSDASLGFTAPDTDNIGNPRFDDPGIEPNTGAGAFTFYDMGAFERQEISEPDADLEIQLIPAPTSVLVGDTVTVSWTVTNRGPNVAFGPWVDTVSLIFDDPTALPPPILLEVEHTESLGVGNSYTVNGTFRVPGFPVGSYRWIVATDDRNQVFEAQFENNNEARSEPIPVDMTELILGVPLAARFTADGDEQWYKLQTTEGQNIRLTLDREGVGGRSELFVGQNYTPDMERFDLSTGKFGGPDAILDIASTSSGLYYVLARGITVGPTPLEYQLLAQTYDFEAFGVTPTSGGNAGQVTVTITGQAIPVDATASLVTATGQEIAAVATHWVDSTRLLAAFNLQGQLPGPADMVIESGAEQRILDDAFRMDAGGKADFFLRITGPDFIRVGREVEYTVNWGNRGNIDASVHLVHLQSSNIVNLSLEPGGESLEGGHLFLAMSPSAATPVIPAGAQESMKIYVTTTDLGDFGLQARFIAVDSSGLASQSVDWDSFRAEAKTGDLTDAQLDALFGQLRSQLDDDWATFTQMLAADSLEILHEPDSPIFPESAGMGLRPGLLDEIGEAAAALGWQQSGSSAPLLFFRAASKGPPPPPPPPQVRALVVTAQNYQGTGDSNVPGTASDLRIVLSALRRAENTNINAVTDQPGASTDKPELNGQPSNRVSSIRMQLAVRGLAASANPGDTLFIYYTGHGDRRGFAVGDGSTYSYRDFLNDLRPAKAAHIVIVADNCNSGTLIDTFTDPIFPNLGPTVTMITSSRSDQTSDDSPRGGIFTVEFFKALSDPDNDANKDGEVSVEEAYKKMPKQLRDFFDKTISGAQNPISLIPIDVGIGDATGRKKDPTEKEAKEDIPSIFDKLTGLVLINELKGLSGRPRDPNDKATSGITEQGWILPDQFILYGLLPRFGGFGSKHLILQGIKNRHWKMRGEVQT